MDLSKKPEVLAPAGTLEAVVAAFAAGADAVYFGGKTLNMRQHRGSYNLTDEEVAEAIRCAHQRGRRAYYVLNSLACQEDLPEVRSTLARLGELGSDALIVQDLGAAALAREICVQIPLHASTMMNVHSAATARALRGMGFTRAIASRDIPLHEVRRIGEAGGLEMEYFIHGDMCIAHGAQCHLSGLLLGRSANSGMCMKPCRWQWTLAGGQTAEEAAAGYLLARKDMCMLGHIPELVRNGVASLKIEGRMRTAEFLAPIIAAYRRAVDSYFADPAHYSPSVEDVEMLQARRVRDFTTAHALGNPGPVSVDTTGRREPRFFSRCAPAPAFSGGGTIGGEGALPSAELIVRVSDAACAEAAERAGADAVYLDGDGLPQPATLSLDRLARFAESMARRGGRVGVLGSRIADERDIEEWRQLLGQLSRIGNLTVGVSSLGALQAAHEAGFAEVLADFAFNVANSVAADELSTLGAARCTASVEMNSPELLALLQAARLPVEIIVQGPLAGMLLEHCLVASAEGASAHDVCHMRCRRGRWRLRDTSGQEFPLVFDRRCRNHVYTPADLCALPYLPQLLAGGAAGVRIEAQLDAPEAVAAVTALYRQALDALREGRPLDAGAAAGRIAQAVGRPLTNASLTRVRSAISKETPHAAARADRP